MGRPATTAKGAEMKKYLIIFMLLASPAMAQDVVPESCVRWEGVIRDACGDTTRIEVTPIINHEMEALVIEAISVGVERGWGDKYIYIYGHIGEEKKTYPFIMRDFNCIDIDSLITAESRCKKCGRHY